MNGTRQQIEWFLSQLTREKKVSFGDAIWWKNITCPFRGGMAEASHCDTSAFFIAKQFNAFKAGYSLADNPKAILGRSCKRINGHAFAIVGELLIDWWAVHIAKQSDKMILHLEADRRIIAKLYGDKTKWESFKFSVTKK